MSQYFTGLVQNTVVINTAHGLGTVRAVQESKKHGILIHVLFGRPQRDSFQKMFNGNGCLISDGIAAAAQSLFYVDDKDMIEIQSRLRVPAPLFENSMYDTAYIGMEVYDMLYGWGRVVQKSDDDQKLMNVDFMPHYSGVIGKTYDRHGYGAGGLCKERRLFTADEMKNGIFAKALNEKVKGDTAPETFQKMKSVFHLSLAHSSGTKTEPQKEPAAKEKKMWVFFYKPKGATGYLKNVLIGTGIGETILDAMENLYRDETTFVGTTTRGDAFDDLCKRGQFDRIFAYEATHVVNGDKELCACVEHHIKTQLNNGANGRCLLKAIRANRP